MEDFPMRKDGILSAANICLAVYGTLLPTHLHGQWAPCGTGGPIQCAPTGNVGIGTSTPGAKLEIAGDVLANFLSGSGDGFKHYAGGTHIFSLTRQSNDTSLSAYGAIGFVGGASGPSSNYQLYRSSGGLVGIGTTSPQQLLDVAGTMAAREIIVTQTGADYVFDPDYHLAPLSEVASYIKDHHHLPDIPSAAEMKENGIGVADMQAKLLAKIEELTLHMIEAEERSNRLEEENRDLRKTVQDIKEEIAR
jgi:hypothetical protein